MFCLRTSEPFNSPTLCRGQGSREYRRYQILLSISHLMPCLRTLEHYNSSRQRQRAGDSGISLIANISIWFQANLEWNQPITFLRLIYLINESTEYIVIFCPTWREKHLRDLLDDITGFTANTRSAKNGMEQNGTERCKSESGGVSQENWGRLEQVRTS